MKFLRNILKKGPKISETGVENYLRLPKVRCTLSLEPHTRSHHNAPTCIGVSVLT